MPNAGAIARGHGRQCALFALTSSIIVFLLYRIGFVEWNVDLVWTRTNSNPVQPTNRPSCGYLALQAPEGRLGNQMFSYASFYGIARTQETTANKTAFVRAGGLPSLLDGVYEKLTLPEKILPDAWFQLRNFTNLTERRGCCTYDDHGLGGLACDGRNVVIAGWRHVFKYFVNYSQEIRREFTFKREIREQCRQLINDSLLRNGLSPSCITVGVHLRRGDFTLKQKIDFGHWPAQLGYLKKAVRFFELKLNESGCVAFLIFGDDYEWNERNSGKLRLLRPNNTRLILMDWRNSSAPVDLCAMWKCDHMAVSTGTFGWWAGFFSTGTVTRQRVFARPGSRHYAAYSVRDYFPSHWIPL